MRISRLKKQIFGAVTLALMLFGINHLLGNALEDISSAKTFVNELNAYESEGEQIDLVFVGGSRVEMTFAPDVFEEKLELNRVINAGSFQQSLEGSYYQLKDLIDRFHPRYAVLGISGQALSEPDNEQADLFVMRKISPSTRALFLLECKDTIAQITIPMKVFRYRYYFANLLSKAPELLREVFTQDQTNSNAPRKHRFTYGTNSMEDGNISIHNPIIFEESEFDPRNVEYLDRIVELCAENNVQLFITTAPTSMMRIYCSEDYQRIVDYYTDYAESHGLIYQNLSYLRDRESFLPDSKMTDYNHVNGEGAYLVSELYAEILKANIAGEDVSNYFYASLDELKESVHRIVAVGANIETSPENTITIQMISLHNDDVVPQYQVLLATDGENFEVIMDWAESDTFELNASTAPFGSLYQIRARTGEPGEIEAFQNYKY